MRSMADRYGTDKPNSYKGVGTRAKKKPGQPTYENKMPLQSGPGRVYPILDPEKRKRRKELFKLQGRS